MLLAGLADVQVLMDGDEDRLRIRQHKLMSLSFDYSGIVLRAVRHAMAGPGGGITQLALAEVCVSHGEAIRRGFSATTSKHTRDRQATRSCGQK